MSSASDPCSACAETARSAFSIPFSMAFQPIISVPDMQLVGHEALVRGADGSSAYSVLSQLTDANRYHFDQACRIRSITLAKQMDLTGVLSINFMPNAIYEPERCLRTTVAAADRTGFDLGSILFELTETEAIADVAHIRNIIETYRTRGLKTAIDDFGAGYAGLDLLADIEPDIVKIDMHLIRGVDTDSRRRHILDAIVGLCQRLGIQTIAEGIETIGELEAVVGSGVDMVQGYLLGIPRFEALTEQVEIAAAVAEAGRTQAA